MNKLTRNAIKTFFFFLARTKERRINTLRFHISYASLGEKRFICINSICINRIDYSLEVQ